MASIAFQNLVKTATLSDGTTYGYIHVTASPVKPTFLPLHGASRSSYIWYHQMELLPIFGLDLLGYAVTQTSQMT
ncbi:hypothetical protein V8F20_002916 [Naviculisporaceae sp. PSN 640]